MLLYLSGPMTGIPEFNYPAFNQAAGILRGLGFDVINPAETAGGEINLPREVFMRIDVGYVQAVDAIVTLPGWQHSKGAKLECILAASLGKRIYTYDPLRGLGTLIQLDNWGINYKELVLRPLPDAEAQAPKIHDDPDGKIVPMFLTT